MNYGRFRFEEKFLLFFPIFSMAIVNTLSSVDTIFSTFLSSTIDEQFGISEIVLVAPVNGSTSNFSENFYKHLSRLTSAVALPKSQSGSKILRFFQKLGNDCPHRKMVVLEVSGIMEVAQLLNQIADFNKYTSRKNESFCPNTPTLIIVPSEQTHLTLTTNEIKSLVLENLEESATQHFNLDTSVYLAFSNKTLHGPAFDVWELYSIQNEIFFKRVKKAHPSKILRRRDWNGVEIRSVPFSLAENLNEKGEVEGIEKFEFNVKRDPNVEEKFNLISGLSASVFQDLGAFLNFTPSVRRPITYNDGLTKTIQKHKNVFDIILTHFAYVAGGSPAADYLFPTYLDGIVAHFVQPDINSVRNIHLSPFTPTMWLLVLSTWIVISLSLKLITPVRNLFGVDLQEKCETNYEQDNDNNDQDKLMSEEAPWWAVAAACQQGWHTTPSLTSSRVIFFTGLMFSFLCYSSYTAIIVATLGKTVVPITDLKNLLQTSKTIYIVKGSDVGKIIVDGMAIGSPETFSKVHLTNVPTALQYVLKSQRGSSCILDWPAFFVETARKVLEASMKENAKVGNSDVQICKQISKLNYEYFPVKASMLVHKESPFTKYFNYAILFGFERGLFRRYWQEYYWNSRVHCLVENTHIHPMDIYDTSFVFVVLSTGFVLSVIILIAEIAYKKQLPFL